ncbi:MAG: VCBS domain-containing protein [Thalassotalea sp.]
MTKNLLTLAMIASLSACGGSGSSEPETNIVATFSGDITGSVTEDVNADATGTVTVTDPDSGEASIQAITNVAGSYGNFSITADGAWTYTLDNSNVLVQALSTDSSLTETVTVQSADGTTQVLIMTINGADDTPVIGSGDGVDVGVIDATSNAPIMGTLTISGGDDGENAFVAQTATTGNYGTFSIAINGQWSYELFSSSAPAATASINKASAKLTAVAVQQQTDVFPVQATDGSSHSVTITISGDIPGNTPPVSECTGTSSLSITAATDDGTYDKTSEPAFAIDGKTDTDAESRWSSDASNADKYIIFELGEQAKIKKLDLLWLKADQRTTYFDIETSTDNSTWLPVLTSGESTLASDSSYSFETVDLTESEGRYVRLTSSGNSASGWVSLVEAKVLGCKAGDTGTDPVAAVISGDITGTVTEDTTLTATGTLTVVDPNTGEDAFVAQAAAAGSYGTLAIDTAGAWTYTLTNDASAVQALDAGDTLTDMVTVVTVDGTMQTITITINGTDEAAGGGGGGSTANAVITGDLAKTTVNTFDDDFEGTVYINDADGDAEEVTIAQTDTITTYGTFSINADGEWVYELDTSNSAVAALASASDTLTDTIVIATADGTTADIVITISGQDAIIIDPTPVAGDDTVPTVNCTQTVNSISALEDAADDLVAGDTLCLADGTYTGDLELRVEGIGTESSPITVAAENPGSAIITGGEMSINIGGEYVVIQGFVLRDGESGSSIIKFEKETECNYCRVTEMSIIDMDNGDYGSSNWIDYYGHHNRIDHNWISGKESRGVMLKLGRWTSESDFAANGFITDLAQIDHNYFGDRAPAWGRAYAGSDDNEYEGIRLGLSTTHSAPSLSIVENNYFERIQGEAEIISNKSADNIIRNNTIRDSNGSIVTRHGEGATISNNFIFGDDNPFSGGIRLVDGEHVVTNNYIEGARFLSSNWNGGIVLTTGDGSGDGENGYQNVENVLVAHNTIVDSVNSINVYGGKNDEAPDGVYFVNNIVADAIGPVIRTNGEDMPTNSTYDGNYVFGEELSDNEDSYTGFTFVDAMLEKGSDGLYRPSLSSPSLTAAVVDTGDFDLPTIDMDGQTRSSITTAGADETLADTVLLAPLTSDDVGPKSYRPTPGKVYVQKVDIANHDFDSGDLTGWTDNTGSGAAVTQDDDVFSRGNSLVLDSNAADVSQTVTVVANTNYTLSAFMKGSAKLSVTVDGQTYAAERTSDSYGFSSVTFNSGAGTSAVITASVDDLVTNKAPIINPNFDDGDDDWTVVEGTGIGQVQDSSNSAGGADGSIKFKWNDGADTGTPHQPYIAQTVTVEANTDYTMSIYNLNKSDNDDSSILFGVSSDSDITVTASHVASKDSIYSSLEDVTEKGDDSFYQDTLTFNSGSNTSLTVFAQFKSTTGAEVRVDQFELSYTGAPTEGTEAFFDSIRLVSQPLSEAESITAEDD